MDIIGVPGVEARRACQTTTHCLFVFLSFA
jgi:hypothetical protein